MVTREDLDEALARLAKLITDHQPAERQELASDRPPGC
jgi:hypothetical protein